MALLLVLVMLPTPSAYAIGMRDGNLSPFAVALHPSTSKPAVGYTYTVRAADTLWGIAAAHSITVGALIAANKLVDPRLLRPGQKIFVPAPPPTIEPAPAPAAVEQTTTTEPPPAPEPAPVAAPNAVALPPEIADWPAQLLALINADRAAQGIAALALSPALTQAAQAHAEDCARRNAGSHVGSDGARLRERLARINYEPSWASENWANAQDVAHAHGLWWNEAPGQDPHRRNILDPRYTEVGIGVARGAWGYYLIADFSGW